MIAAEVAEVRKPPFSQSLMGLERAERNMGVRYVARSRILGGYNWRISCVPLCVLVKTLATIRSYQLLQNALFGRG